MTLLLIGVAVLVGGGLAALLASARPRLATTVGAGASVAGCALGLVPAARALLGAPPEPFRAAWSVPYGSLSLGLDPLSAVFLLPTLVLGAIASVYGAGYLGSRGHGRRLGSAWLVQNLLLASLVAVVVARNGVLFLVAWEVMALASFALVVFEDELESVRRAGWTYLVATHLGTAFLLALFVLLGRGSESLDFEGFAAGGARAPGALFLLALAGFGTKAGLMPVHVWLPEAHPAAPSHVSALLSAVMIKTGVYGILRTLTFLGPPSPWWGWTLVAVGGASAVLGILFALAQGDLKRLLAYSSVENVGWIAVGIGLGLLGQASGLAALAVLGFAAALFHVWSHGVMKALLFLGAGSILHATGTRELSRLGGLLKRMPWTGLASMAGAAAIAGLPPFSGFASELLLLTAAFRGGLGGAGAAAQGLTSLEVLSLGVIAAVALVAGLAAAAFAKAAGIALLGEPRSEEAARARESGLLLRVPMGILVLGTLALGAAAPLAVRALEPALAVLGLPAQAARDGLRIASETLALVAVAGAVLAGLSAVLAVLRLALLARREVRSAVTWDCGYARPTARMQYT
ncbi:MAG: oxidoreductase, partial [Planctomycetes bacterium]|nr:oxidoreductase [Planctomycetota bacterium]